jgi:hypothetical protein
MANDLPPQVNMPIHCHCGRPNGQFAADPYHALSCQCEAKGRYQRHQGLEQCVASWTTAVGSWTQRQPTKHRLEEDMEGDNRRPDLYVCIGGKQYLIDVTVRHAMAPSHIKDAAKGAKTVLKQAEAEKHERYDELAASTGAKLIPFAVDTAGVIGDEALKFIKDIIKEASNYKVVWQPRRIVYGIYREVVMAVIKGNAAIFESNYRKCQAAELRGM